PGLAVHLAPAIIVGGQSTTGKVTLPAPAPEGGVILTLASGDPTVATVPERIVIPAGAISADFPVATSPVVPGRSVRISAASGELSAAARLQVVEPALTALAFDPPRSVGGQPVAGRVTLSGPAPAGGMEVALTSYGAPFSV